MVEIEKEEGSEQQVARFGDLQGDYSSSGADRSRHLGEGLVDIRDVPEGKTDRRAIEVAARHGQRLGLTHDQADAPAEPEALQLLDPLAEHRLARVHPDRPTAASDGFDRKVTRSDRHIQGASSGWEPAFANGKP